MPQLSELIGKQKFVKKEYRPWDLSGKGTVDGKDTLNVSPLNQKNSIDAEKHSISNEQIATDQQPETVQVHPVTKKTYDKTGNKLGNNTGNKEVTNRQQRDNKQVTNRQQRDNKQVTNRQQPGNITGNVTDNVTGNTEWQIYLVDTIKKLSGIQKSIFYYIINICSARNALETGNVLSSDLANAANCSVGSAKTSLVRLLEKHLVLRLPGKACRGGHMVLGMTTEIQAAAIQAHHALFNPPKMTFSDNNTGNNTGNTPPYSSSSYKNNTTTTVLPEEWQKINFETLKHIGFSETQLRQLFDSNMTGPELVQDALNRFAYSLQHSIKVKAYNDPLNVLMGVLRKGQRWVEPNYVPPKELALRQLLEEKRKQKEQQELMIKELVELEFPDWRRKLTEDEIKMIVPDDIRKTNLTAAVTSTLRTYFVEKILLPKLEE
jgi:hypothetical protein